jgi:hypothetical protein
MDTQLTAWLNEGLKHFATGDRARALECWTRILAVEPDHPGALDYVAFVQSDMPRDAPAVSSTSPEPPAAATPQTSEAPPLEHHPSTPSVVEPSPTTAATPPEAPTSPPMAAEDLSPLMSTSWADALATDVDVPPLPDASEAHASAAVAAVPIDVVVEAVAATPVDVASEAVAANPVDVVTVAVAANPVAAVIEARPPPEPSALPLPAPDVPELPGNEPAPPAIARWASPRVASTTTPASPAVSDYEPLEPFDAATEPEAAPFDLSQRPGAGFTAPPAPPSLVPPGPPGPPATAPSAPPGPPGDVARPPWLSLVPPAPSHIEVSAAPPAPADLLAPPASMAEAPASPVLRTPLSGEVYRSGASVDVLPPLRTPAAEPPGPRAAPIEERVVRQSVRYDEPVDTSPAFVASVHAKSVAVSEEKAPTTAAERRVASPWDSDSGPAAAIDLDARPSPATPTPMLSVVTSEGAQPPSATSASTTAPAATDELETLMTGARELFSLGDFSGSLELVEKVLQQNPSHEGARAYLKRNESTLLKMYESKLGRLNDVPRQLVPADEVIWLNMHHRAGFILSQVDGTLSYEDILDVSGMDRFDTIRILAELVQNGIVGVKG